MSDTKIAWSPWNLCVIPEVSTDFKDAKVVQAVRSWKGAMETRWYAVSSSQIPEWNVDETLVFPCMIDSQGKAVPRMREVAGTYPRSFMYACSNLLDYLATL